MLKQKTNALIKVAKQSEMKEFFAADATVTLTATTAPFDFAMSVI